MPDVRYVVLSDLHLGAENSLLTHLEPGSVETDPSQPSTVMIELVSCLRDLIGKNEGTQKPKLILNGDLIELALSATNKAAMAFQRFIELIMPSGGEQLFDSEIIFLPGNHDHNLWESSRNMHYVDLLCNLEPGARIIPEIHATGMFKPDYIHSNFLSSLIHCYPHLKDVNVRVCYPAYAELHAEQDRCLVFCHGHYIESMYSLMSHMNSAIFPNQQAPLTLEDLEAENYAWVDFFWSTLGRSGKVGKDIDLIYDKLQDGKAVNQMLAHIAGSQVQKRKFFLRRWIEKTGLTFFLKLSLGRLAANERNEPQVQLSPDATAGLTKLMEVHLYHQLRQKLDGRIPAEVSFMFGHTHKPFMRRMPFNGFSNPIDIYNSGGWVVDTLADQPLHGGSVILADENFEVTVLQMYREGDYRVSMEALRTQTGAVQNAFFNRLSRIVPLNNDPWTRFSEAVREGVQVRHRNLKTFIEEKA